MCPSACFCGVRHTNKFSGGPQLLFQLIAQRFSGLFIPISLSLCKFKKNVLVRLTMSIGPLSVVSLIDCYMILVQ